MLVVSGWEWVSAAHGERSVQKLGRFVEVEIWLLFISGTLGQAGDNSWTQRRFSLRMVGFHFKG